MAKIEAFFAVCLTAVALKVMSMAIETREPAIIWVCIVPMIPSVTAMWFQLFRES